MFGFRREEWRRLREMMAWDRSLSQRTILKLGSVSHMIVIKCFFAYADRAFGCVAPMGAYEGQLEI